ncbi:glutathione synthase [Bowmanella dokdonensis]|uniref:glutathione synthase n=1 Tax=Bowmanella dokdonensis TaxID=751969 RepID=A0A939DQN5_9ALTE|nr:glutathione synthase [Bowmanella dokdonensis]MBN7827015.1 glutathione synthase [Bowmanella dokdonensis]
MLHPLPISQLNWQQAMADQQIGMLDTAGQFAPLPVSLSPWRLSTGLWSQVIANSQLLGNLLSGISQQRQWLLQQFTPLMSGHSLTGALARQLSQLEPAQIRAQGLPLMRHDMLLDKAGKWRWVESNSIAAGMGPLSENWQQLLRAQLAPCCQVDNPATSRQSALLAGAAMAMRRRFDNQAPLMLFVVEETEDNLFDQQCLSQAIEARGVRVKRITLEHLASLAIRNRRLVWPGDQKDAATEVDLLYFRTGYNRQDYQTEAQLALRATLETLDLVLCPNIALQLAGSKWLQARLYESLQAPWTAAQLQRQLNLSLPELARLHSLLVPSRTLDSDDSAVRHKLDKGWLLKSEQEGGGSVLNGPQAIDRLKQGIAPDAGWIAMAPIDTAIRQAPVAVLRQGQFEDWSGVVSELGLFTLGSKQQYGGYLLRSKPAGQLEGGVHRGGAVLDSLQVC